MHRLMPHKFLFIIGYICFRNLIKIGSHMTFFKLFAIIYFFYTISSILISHLSPHLTFPNLLLTIPLSYQICSTISISLASSLFLWLFFIVLQTNMSVMVLSNDQHMRENMWLILRKLMTINNGNDVGGEKLLLLVEK